MSSETITRTDLTNILNEVLPTTQGHTIYKGAWTSSGTSAYGVRVTEELTLDKGLYAIEVIVPVPSATFMVGLHVGSEASTQQLMYGGSGDAYERSTFLCEIPTDGTKVATYSEASASVTYSNLDRGGIHAIQLVRYYGSPEVDYIVEQGTDGIWTYRKWNNGSYEAVYVGNVNMQAGSAMGGGYFHQTSSALTPPSFSQTVKSLHGSANGAVLFSYVGHANDYSTYWWNASSTAVSNVAVRLVMNGTWK